jgi:hypothetical protein
MGEVHDATSSILDATTLDQLARRSEADRRPRPSLQRYHI